MVEELQLTFKGYHQLNEMSPGHESTISTNFEKSDETLHIHIYIYILCSSFSSPLSSPSSPPRAIKPFPRAEAKYIVKKERAAAWMKASWHPPPSLPSQTDHPLPLKNALRERERERERNSTWDFCLPSLALVAIESTWSIDEKFRDDQSWTRQRTGQFLIFVEFVRLVLLSSIHFPIDISLSGFFFPLFCALVIALEEEKGRKEGRGREKEG